MNIKNRCCISFKNDYNIVEVKMIAGERTWQEVISVLVNNYKQQLHKGLTMGKIEDKWQAFNSIDDNTLKVLYNLPPKQLWERDGVNLVINDSDDNAEFMQEMCLQKLVYFCQKLGVDFAGEGNIKRLMAETNNNYMDVHNLLLLPVKIFENTIGVNGIKFYESLHDHMKTVTISQFMDAVGAFGEGIGELKLQKIIDLYGELPYDRDKILNVDGWAEISVDQYMFKYATYINWVKWLYENYNNFVFKTEEKKQMSNKFSNIVVVFTGVRDKELEEVIKANGGKIVTSFTKACNTVIAKDPNGDSSKLNKAREKGAEILSLEDAWLKFGNY